MISLTKTRRSVSRALALILGCAPLAAFALDKVEFYSNWFPQAENGAFYQAKAAGIYERYGLDVTLNPGGPQVNGSMLVLGKRADFAILHSEGELLSALEKDLPLVAVAAMYQKDPQVVVSHKGVGNDSLEALKGKPIMLSQDAMTSFWPWLKHKYGYDDAQIRPYTFQMAPFLVNKQAIQQSFLTSEPFAIKQADVDPNVFLLSDHGWEPVSVPLVTRSDLVKSNPDLVRRFVQATLEGWYAYLQDPSAGNALIKQLVPEMLDGQIQYSLKEMKDHGIVVSGDALTLGIGAMTDARWKAFYDEMSAVGLYKQGMDYRRVFSLDFVNDKAFAQQMQAKYPQAMKNGSPEAAQ